jgi:amino acid permease
MKYYSALKTHSIRESGK